MGGATSVYNGKITPYRFPLDFPFTEYLLDSISEKSPICNLVSDGTDFVPPLRNTDQLLHKLVLNMFLIPIVL